jgi:hypothetical protein
MADQAEAYEEQNVHEVYQQIAGHFSATRYKVSDCPASQLIQTEANESITASCLLAVANC